MSLLGRPSRPLDAPVSDAFGQKREHSPPVDRFDELIVRAREAARTAGMKRSGIEEAIGEARSKR